jgi:DNA-binding CsgD family transcriptional regulator
MFVATPEGHPQCARDEILPIGVRAISMATATELPRIGVRPIRDIAWGSHLCLFFQTTEDLLETLVPYFKAGLEGHEYALWVLSGRLTKERATTALRQAVPDLDRFLAGGSLDIVLAREWYRKGGRLDLRRVIRGWHERLRHAAARGYAGMRVSGTAAWLETKTEWNDFLEYEAALNDALRNRRMIVLCTYALAMCGAGDMLDVARTHQLALARRSGAWQAVAWREMNGSLNRYAALTPRERQVLHLVAGGRRSSEIAGQLSISVKTVEVHRANLMRKLEVRNQTELVRYALRLELSPQEHRPR